MNDKIDHLTQALDYVEHGFAVYPLVENTKVPIKGTHGFNSASNDLATVRNWYNEHDYNIGLKLADKNILVIDMDVGHESGFNGIASYQRLYKEHHFQPLPQDSYIERTPSGGLHWFLSYPEGTPVKTIQSAFGKDTGIDVITSGIPVYPTMINNKRYQPLDGRTLADIKPASPWVLDLFKTTEWHYDASKYQGQQKKYTGRLFDEIVAGTTAGNRNNWLTRITGKLFRSGADPKTIYNLLLVINDNFIGDPLPDDEVNTIFNSILKRESKVTA